MTINSCRGAFRISHLVCKRYICRRSESPLLHPALRKPLVSILRFSHSKGAHLRIMRGEMGAICIRSRIECDFAHLQFSFSLFLTVFFFASLSLSPSTSTFIVRDPFVLFALSLQPSFPSLTARGGMCVPSFNTGILNRSTKKRWQSTRMRNGRTARSCKCTRQGILIITLAQARASLFFCVVGLCALAKSSGSLN